MAKSRSTEMKPIRWLIISGFGIASLSVVAMAFLAYSRLVDLRQLVKETGKPDQYVTLIDGLMEDFDQASLDVRREVLAGRKEAPRSLNMLLDKRQETYVLLDTLAKDLGLEEHPELVQRLEKRYDLFGQMIAQAGELELKPPSFVPQPPKRRRSRRRRNSKQESSIDSIYIQYLFSQLEEDTLNRPEVSTSFWADSSVYPPLFSALVSYAEAENEQKKRIEALMEQEQFLIQDLSLLKGELTYQLNSRGRNGFIAVERSAANANIFIGVATVMILTLCALFLVKIIGDLEKNRRLELQLQEEKARAEELAKAKEEFLANMSHEMRTPMNAIIGFSDQLSDTSLDVHQERLLNPIRHSADLLLSLINDVLDYTKLEVGKFELAQQPFNIKEVVEEVHQLFIPQAKAKGIDLRIQFLSNIPKVVIGDALRLKQMLLNLVGNSVKFTDKGSVSLSVQKVAKVPTIPNGVGLQFVVADTGIGIPPEAQARIFEDFNQVDSSNTRKYGGTGLGLSITKKLTELHDGKIDLRSEVGQGTEVFLMLPYEEGQSQEVQKSSNRTFSPHPGLEGKQILVADDDLYNRMLVKGLLENWKVKITEAQNGKEVVNALQRGERFDLMFMDMNMPELNGLQTTQKIREEFQLQFPIVALTANSSPKEREKAFQAGMQSFLLKPFKAHELHQALLNLLDISTAEQQSESSQAPMNEQDTPFPALYRMSRGDTQMIKRMLEQYLALTDTNFQALRKAVQSKDAKQTALLAHRMVPAHRHLGFDEVVKKLKRIEEMGNNNDFSTEMKQLIQELPDSLEACKQKVNQVLLQEID